MLCSNEHQRHHYTALIALNKDAPTGAYGSHKFEGPCSNVPRNTQLFVARLAALGSYSKLTHAEQNETTYRGIQQEQAAWIACLFKRQTDSWSIFIPSHAVFTSRSLLACSFPSRAGAATPPNMGPLGALFTLNNGIIDNLVQNGVQKRMYVRSAALLNPELKTNGLKHYQSFV